MAADSVTTSPPGSTSTGTWPLGFSSTKGGERSLGRSLSPRCHMFTRVCGAPALSSAASTTKLPVPTAPWMI